MLKILEDRPEELAKSRFHFIGSSTNDRIYTFLSRPKQFKVEKKKLSDK